MGVPLLTVMARAVFLDRDGVINRAIIRDGRPHPPSGFDELELLPGVTEACTALRRAGYLLVMVTNQPDVARSRQQRKAVETINNALRLCLGLTDVRVCYHDDSANCPCRKPRPGLLLEASRKLGIELSESFMVGDRSKDIEAGRRAGCMTIFVDYGYSERLRVRPDQRACSLSEATDWILGRPR